MKTKKCSKCGEAKPVDKFRMRSGRNYRRKECIQCQSEQQYLTQKRHPEKMRARTLARAAKKKGLLAAPDKCEACDASKKLLMHHDNYDKPYDVRWMCVPCHRVLHKNIRNVAS